MSSYPIKILMRIAGLVITILLLVQPWLFSAEFASPFINSGWIQIIASTISILVSAILLAFYRPIKTYDFLSTTLFIIIIAIGVSLYYTHYNVCLRISYLTVGLLACLGTLRLFRKESDNFSIAGMISLSGFLMAIYCLYQYNGYDFLTFENKYTVVGTLTNPNFLGIFLCVTSAINLGLVFELHHKSLKHCIVFLALLITQIVVIILLKKTGLYICLLFMILIWFWSDKFSFSGKLSRKSPLITGFILAITLLAAQWGIHYTTLHYPWEKITVVHYSDQTFVSRIILWQMGFGVFKAHPFTGTGLGSLPYIMPSQRPATGTTLRISNYNDDPHSFIISILSEIGFLGLWGISSLLVIVFGAFIRKKSKYEPIDYISLDEKESKCESETKEESEITSESKTEIETTSEPEIKAVEETENKITAGTTKDIVEAKAESEVKAKEDNKDITETKAEPEAKSEEETENKTTEENKDITETKAEPEAKTAKETEDKALEENKDITEAEAKAELESAKDTENKVTAETNNETVSNEESKIEIKCENKLEPELIHFPWIFTLIALIILYLSFKSGFIRPYYLPYGIISVIILFGIITSVINNSYKATKNDYYLLSKGTLTAILTFIFYSTFNNTFSIIPLTGLLVLVFSLHLSCSLPDVRYKQKITGISLLFVILPIIYGIVSYQLQLNFQNEQKKILEGAIAETKNDWKKSEKCYLEVINSNQQYLPAYEGLANSLYNQGLIEKKLGLDENEQGNIEKKLGNIEKEQSHLDKAKFHFDKAKLKLEEAQDILTQIDIMVPNINYVKLKIANILLENNKILEAHRFAMKNLEWYKDSPSYELLGNILLLEGRMKEAEEIFKEGLIRTPSNQTEIYATDRIHLTMAALASYKNDYNSCKVHISQIKTQLVSDNIETLYIKGQILTHEKKYDDAFNIFEKIYSLYPEEPRILNALGYLLLQDSKDLSRAQMLLEKSFNLIKKDKNSTQFDLLNVTNSLGKLYQKQNKLDKASELLKLSYENTPDEYSILKEERRKDLENFYNSFKPAE